MKKLCFGTLLNLIYQAKGQSVTYKSICDAVFSVYGCDDTTNRDKSLPSHLKSGHDSVPPDVIKAARDMSHEDAVDGFEDLVVGLIAEANAKQFIYAVKNRVLTAYGACEQKRRHPSSCHNRTRSPVQSACFWRVQHRGRFECCCRSCI